MPKQRFVRAAQLMLGTALAVLSSMPCRAQSTGMTAPANKDASALDQRAAILKELEAMKERIAELEAQLQKTEAKQDAPRATKVQVGSPGVAVTPVSDPRGLTISDTRAHNMSPAASSNPLPSRETAAQVPNESSSMAPAQGSATQSVPSQQNRAKIAPFSDHDWTWLNGNPRTETPAFDSKCWSLPR